ncbi:MAG: hypothetical protein AAB574_00360 [Patescibacteria group bacterium]
MKINYDSAISIKAIGCGANATIHRGLDQYTLRRKVGDAKGIKELCGGCVFRRVPDQPNMAEMIPGQKRLRACVDENAPTT